MCWGEERVGLELKLHKKVLWQASRKRGARQREKRFRSYVALYVLQNCFILILSARQCQCGVQERETSFLSLIFGFCHFPHFNTEQQEYWATNHPFRLVAQPAAQLVKSWQYNANLFFYLFFESFSWWALVIAGFGQSWTSQQQAAK